MVLSGLFEIRTAFTFFDTSAEMLKFHYSRGIFLFQSRGE